MFVKTCRFDCFLQVHRVCYLYLHMIREFVLVVILLQDARPKASHKLVDIYNYSVLGSFTILYHLVSLCVLCLVKPPLYTIILPYNWNKCVGGMGGAIESCKWDRGRLEYSQLNGYISRFDPIDLNQWYGIYWIQVKQ